MATTRAALTPIFDPKEAIHNTDLVAESLKGQAERANKEVSAAIEALKDGPDNPALLADLQHKINKWSVVFGINSTIVRAWKDLMQGILQKI